MPRQSALYANVTRAHDADTQTLSPNREGIPLTRTTTRGRAPSPKSLHFTVRTDAEHHRHRRRIAGRWAIAVLLLIAAIAAPTPRVVSWQLRYAQMRTGDVTRRISSFDHVTGAPGQVDSASAYPRRPVDAARAGHLRGTITALASPRRFRASSEPVRQHDLVNRAGRSARTGADDDRRDRGHAELGARRLAAGPRGRLADDRQAAAFRRELVAATIGAHSRGRGGRRDVGTLADLTGWR
jgi:hypothetical protein